MLLWTEVSAELTGRAAGQAQLRADRQRLGSAPSTT